MAVIDSKLRGHEKPSVTQSGALLTGLRLRIRHPMKFRHINTLSETSALCYSVHPQGDTGLHCLQINIINNQANLLLVKALGKNTPFKMPLAERHLLT